MRLTEADHARVTTAVGAAEATTDGEIVTIVASRSDGYRDVALYWSLLAALLLIAVVSAMPDTFVDILDRADGWTHGHDAGTLLALLMVAQVAMFLVVRLALSRPSWQIALTPRATKAGRVRRRAVELFTVGTEKRTVGHVGVLLYLSLAEHQAEIVADRAIHEKTTPECWADAMTVLIEAVRDGRPADGMAAAVAEIGKVLAVHFPKTGDDGNELPDRLIEL